MGTWMEINKLLFSQLSSYICVTLSVYLLQESATGLLATPLVMVYNSDNSGN